MNIPSNSDLTLKTMQDSWKLIKAMAKAHTHEVKGAANTVVEDNVVNSNNDQTQHKLDVVA